MRFLLLLSLKRTMLLVKSNPQLLLSFLTPNPPGAQLLLRAAKIFPVLSQLLCVLQLCCAELFPSHFEMYGFPYLPSST